MGGYSTGAMGIGQERSEMRETVDLPSSDLRHPLAGRRALIVGGSGGIGRGLARALALRGAELFLLGGREAGRMESALAELRSLGAGAEGRRIDLDGEIEIAEFLPDDSPFDIFAMAFGPFLQKALSETTAADWERMLRLNLLLPGALASALLPSMVSKRWGRMVFFGGTATDTIRGFRTNAAYAAAKTGLGVLAKSIALQHADDGIAAFVVCPGLVDTEYLGDRERASYSAKSPEGRLVDANAIGETVAELLARDPCLVSASVISMDAGLAFARGP